MAHRERDHGRKEPLFRKVNTQTHRVWHRVGGDARTERHPRDQEYWDRSRGSMHGDKQRGLDYTPLFRFLLSRVGRPFDSAYSEAVSRLDTPVPIGFMVARTREESRGYFLAGESSYFSRLYVDSEGLLQKVDPSLSAETFPAGCTCCTLTFDGERVPPPPREPDA